MHTNNTNASFSSLASLTSVLVKNKNRADVGDKAVIALFGADYELLSYTIGALFWLPRAMYRKSEDQR